MARALGAGMLRDRISLVKETSVSNGRGGQTRGYETVTPAIACSIGVQRGGEDVQAARLSSVTRYEIIMRHDAVTSALKPSDKLIDAKGTTYLIQWAGSIDEGRKRWMMILATTGEVSAR